MNEPRGAPSVNKWVVAVTVMLPTFIEIMDTSVVNVSLPHIQGSLNAGQDEVTWVLTSYLVSNAIIIPITGWLSSVFGRKRYLLFSILIFTASSLWSGAATSLPGVVLARVFQGLGGGGLQPLSQAILLESFPPSQHGIAMAFFGMGVVLAPVLGPVLGGWLTDHLSWRWVFYINLPVGLLAVALITFFIQDPSYIRRAKAKIDTWGLFLLAVGLGCLQIVLDKGQREDWFSSDFIVVLSLVAAVSLILFVFVEFHTDHPVVNLRVLKYRSFTAGSVIMFAGFFALFGSIVLIPLYLQNLMGYTALLAGLILGPGGLSAFVAMPAAGILMSRGVNPRNLLAVGLVTVAVALWFMAGFNLEADFYAIALPRVLQGFGMGLFFVPLSAATFAEVSREETGNASGIFNLLRNLGGSFGVAFSTTVLARRAQLHQIFLSEHVTPYNPAFRLPFDGISRFLHQNQPDLANPQTALGALYGVVARNAQMLAFNDTFWLLALISASLVPLTFLLRRPKPGRGPTPLH
jgi:DHA2 family multidrug resistance protein